MKVWRLKKGADRRVRGGHPWVFSGEVSHSTRDVKPGELVELRDFQDHFLGFGSAHPTSNIAFRKFTSRSKETDVGSVDFFIRRLSEARLKRQLSGWTDWSHRWIFSEVDGLPGVIVDAYLLASDQWVVVVQISTAGMELLKHNLFEAISTFAQELEGLFLVESPNSRSRVSEGLQVGEKSPVNGDVQFFSKLQAVDIQLVEKRLLQVDLVGGQKTGFFLDQQANIQNLLRLIKNLAFSEAREMRILDICCYVGQWSTQLAYALTDQKRSSAVTLLDVSEGALDLARKNVERAGGQVHVVQDDALLGVQKLEPEFFDVVICDPPGFVKKKADLHVGLAAYVKLLRESMRKVRPGGLLVASSCSGPVRESDWTEALADAAMKAGRSFTVLQTGGHGPDHPTRAEFPEGSYLKCRTGVVQYPF